MNLLMPAIGAGVGLLTTKDKWKDITSPTAMKGALIGAAIGLVISYAAKSGMMSRLSQNTDQLKYVMPGYRQPKLISQNTDQLRYIMPKGFVQPHVRSMGPQFDWFGEPDRVHYY